jgi:hypothetical protein
MGEAIAERHLCRRDASVLGQGGDELPTAFEPAADLRAWPAAAMILRTEGDIVGKPARQHAKTERRAGDHGGAALPGKIDQAGFDGALIEQIEIDLNHRDAELADGDHSILGFAHRNAAGARFALAHQLSHCLEDRAVVTHQPDRRTVELEHIDIVGLQPAQRAFERATQMVGGEIGLLIEARDTRLGRDQDGAAPVPEGLADQHLAVAVSVGVRGVIECHPPIEGAL